MFIYLYLFIYIYIIIIRLDSRRGILILFRLLFNGHVTVARIFVPLFMITRCSFVEHRCRRLDYITIVPCDVLTHTTYRITYIFRHVVLRCALVWVPVTILGIGFGVLLRFTGSYAIISLIGK